MKFIILFFTFSFLIINSVFAITFGEVPGTSDYEITDAPTVSDAGTVVGYITTIVKWTYTIFFIIAVLYVLFAAYGYLAGADNPEAVSKAHKQLMYAAIAVIVALLAVSFNTIVQSVMTGGSSTTATTTTNWTAFICNCSNENAISSDCTVCCGGHIGSTVVTCWK